MSSPSSTAMEQWQGTLGALGLMSLETRLEGLLEHSAKQERSYADFLLELLNSEADARRQRYHKHSAVQWSMAAKIVTVPSASVELAVASVPHIWLGASERMVPSCGLLRMVSSTLCQMTLAKSKVQQNPKLLDSGSSCRQHNGQSHRNYYVTQL